jgi:formate hydrogenlyase subunit 6/NADH:ubiquinone oxidoreductase subunit I
MRFPFVKHALKGIFQSPVTEKYPKVKPVIPQKFRGKIKFHSDLCISCGLCMRVCSPQAITRTIKPVEGGQEITMIFDMGSCTFCNMCADFCSKKAIELTQEYSMVATEKSTLIVQGTFVKKLPPKPPARSVEQAAPKKEE